MICTKQTKEIPTWTRVSENLPINDWEKPWRDRQSYLVRLDNNTLRVAKFGYKKYAWWIDSHNCVIDEKYRTITHWLPITSSVLD